MFHNVALSWKETTKICIFFPPGGKIIYRLWLVRIYMYMYKVTTHTRILRVRIKIGCTTNKKINKNSGWWVRSSSATFILLWKQWRNKWKNEKSIKTIFLWRPRNRPYREMQSIKRDEMAKKMFQRSWVWAHHGGKQNSYWVVRI